MTKRSSTCSPCSTRCVSRTTSGACWASAASLHDTRLGPCSARPARGRFSDYDQRTLHFFSSHWAVSILFIARCSLGRPFAASFVSNLLAITYINRCNHTPQAYASRTHKHVHTDSFVVVIFPPPCSRLANYSPHIVLPFRVQILGCISVQ